MRHTLDFLKQLAHGLAIQFGSSCEIAIHDLKTKDLEKSIVYIENGHVSNRQTGDGPSGIVLETLQSDPSTIHDKLSYLTKTEDGRILKSSTFYIRDDDGSISYIFSLNYDITAFTAASTAIQSLIATKDNLPDLTGDSPRQITHNVNSGFVDRAGRCKGRKASCNDEQRRQSCCCPVSGSCRCFPYYKVRR